jgi:3-(3-hydroxy-phenyl)propionate hydroxylase
MPQATHIPVIVIGAGPVGLTAANLLGQAGIRTLVLERNPGPAAHPRAIVLDDEGARTLQAFGGASYVQQTVEGNGARYYDNDGNCFATVGAGPRNYGFAKRHFIYQHEFEQFLLGHLARFPSVDVKFSETVRLAHAGPSSVTLESVSLAGSSQLTCDWLLACDGARSPVREALGIAFTGSTYEQDWIVLDMARHDDAANFSKFYCSTERPSVSVPAPRGGRRYEFMVQPGDNKDDLLSDASLARLCAPFCKFRPEHAIRRAVYTFHARMASAFRRGRVLLLGDAAHVTPPFAGQGMNSGLRDAHNVAWKLSLILSGAADESIMDSYDVERRGPAWAMIQLAVAMGQVVMPQGADQVAFRDMLLKTLEPFPGVQDYFLQMRFKPKPRYDAGLFVDLSNQRYEASLVGEMIPQPEVLNAADEVKKLDDCLGSGFSLIAQDAAGAATLTTMTHPVWQRLNPTAIHLCEHAKEAVGFVPSFTMTDPIGRPIRTHRDQIMLVRPDRYVAGAFLPSEQFAFAEKIAGLLGPSSRVRLSA